MAKYDSRLDRQFAALSDGTRRAIVQRLTRGPASVSELAAPHDMALPTLLAHLKKLEAAGIVQSEKSGRVRRYRLMKGVLVPVESWLEKQRHRWATRLDRFDAYAKSQMKDRKNDA